MFLRIAAEQGTKCCGRDRLLSGQSGGPHVVKYFWRGRTTSNITRACGDDPRQGQPARSMDDLQYDGGGVGASPATNVDTVQGWGCRRKQDLQCAPNALTRAQGDRVYHMGAAGEAARWRRSATRGERTPLTPMLDGGTTA